MPTIDGGIILNINGEIVPLGPKELDAYRKQAIAKVEDAAVKAKIKAMLFGKKFELIKPVEIGSLNDLNTFLKGNFGVELPDPDLPEPLDTIYERTQNLVLIVEDFFIDVPGTLIIDETKKQTTISGEEKKWTEQAICELAVRKMGEEETSTSTILGYLQADKFNATGLVDKDSNNPFPLKKNTKKTSYRLGLTVQWTGEVGASDGPISLVDSVSVVGAYLKIVSN